jgi:hypothetical protein
MRRFLTDKFGELDQGSELAASLRTIRTACWKFFDQSSGPSLGRLTFLQADIRTIEATEAGSSGRVLVSCER